MREKRTHRNHQYNLCDELFRAMPRPVARFLQSLFHVEGTGKYLRTDKGSSDMGI